MALVLINNNALLRLSNFGSFKINDNILTPLPESQSFKMAYDYGLHYNFTRLNSASNNLQSINNTSSNSGPLWTTIGTIYNLSQYHGRYGVGLPLNASNLTTGRYAHIGPRTTGNPTIPGQDSRLYRQVLKSAIVNIGLGIDSLLYRVFFGFSDKFIGTDAAGGGGTDLAGHIGTHNSIGVGKDYGEENLSVIYSNISTSTFTKVDTGIPAINNNLYNIMYISRNGSFYVEIWKIGESPDMVGGEVFTYQDPELLFATSFPDFLFDTLFYPYFTLREENLSPGQPRGKSNIIFGHLKSETNWVEEAEDLSKLFVPAFWTLTRVFDPGINAPNFYDIQVSAGVPVYLDNALRGVVGTVSLISSTGMGIWSTSTDNSFCNNPMFRIIFAVRTDINSTFFCGLMNRSTAPPVSFPGTLDHIGIALDPNDTTFYLKHNNVALNVSSKTDTGIPRISSSLYELHIYPVMIGGNPRLQLTLFKIGEAANDELVDDWQKVDRQMLVQEDFPRYNSERTLAINCWVRTTSNAVIQNRLLMSKAVMAPGFTVKGFQFIPESYFIARRNSDNGVGRFSGTAETTDTYYTIEGTNTVILRNSNVIYTNHYRYTNTDANSNFGFRLQLPSSNTGNQFVYGNMYALITVSTALLSDTRLISGFTSLNGEYGSGTLENLFLNTHQGIFVGCDHEDDQLFICYSNPGTNSWIKVHTGISKTLPRMYQILIFPRGNQIELQLWHVGNSAGVIHNDWTWLDEPVKVAQASFTKFANRTIPMWFRHTGRSESAGDNRVGLTSIYFAQEEDQAFFAVLPE